MLIQLRWQDHCGASLTLRDILSYAKYEVGSRPLYEHVEEEGHQETSRDLVSHLPEHLVICQVKWVLH